MSDLRDRFRSLDRVRAPDLWSEVSVRATEAGRAPSPWTLNRTVRLGLVLLALALIMSIGIALAAGLLRDERNEPEAFPLAGSIAHCEPALPEGVVLLVRGFGAGEDWPDAGELTVYADGLAVIGPSAEWGGSANTLQASWSQRHLTADGVLRLVEAMTASLASCQSYEFDGNLSVLAADGAEVVSIHLGLDVLETRVTSPAHQAVVDGFAARVDDPDLGLAASDWAESDWHAYVPERWRFSLQFSGSGDTGYPSADGIVLPDGSTLRTFGSEQAGGPDSPPGRCAVTDAEDATAIAAILTDAGGGQGESSSSSWGFSDPEGTIWIMAVGLLPHEPDCMTDPFGAPTPTPAPMPSTAPGEPAPLADACDYVPSSLVGDLIGAVQGEVEHYPGWSSDWAFCWYPVNESGLAIAASRRSFPGERAVEQVRALFGEGFSTERIAGRDVFFNGCATEETCRAAVAISAEPHFVVVIWQGGSQATLREMADRVIQELPAAG
jgi:hypothetical protein